MSTSSFFTTCVPHSTCPLKQMPRDVFDVNHSHFATVAEHHHIIARSHLVGPGHLHADRRAVFTGPPFNTISAKALAARRSAVASRVLSRLPTFPSSSRKHCGAFTCSCAIQGMDCAVCAAAVIFPLEPGGDFRPLQADFHCRPLSLRQRGRVRGGNLPRTTTDRPPAPAASSLARRAVAPPRASSSRCTGQGHLQLRGAAVSGETTGVGSSTSAFPWQ